MLALRPQAQLGFPSYNLPIPPPRPAPKGFRLTEEQAAIVACTSPVVKIQARAGTGKTFVLERRAEARPDDKFLYLAFNRAVKMEAETRFPGNVTCKTGHGLAYQSHGRRFKRNKLGDMRPVQLRQIAPFNKHLVGMDQAAAVLDTLGNYLNSADSDLTLGHIPEDAPVRWPSGSPRARAAAAAGQPSNPEDLDATTVLNLARELWRRARDPQDFDVKMPHDGYLKLYQLTEPELPYDEILLDEAQDSNPVILDIVLRQKGRCRITLVGDNCQSIYGFRQALNAMETVQADAVLTLAQSFRFGPGVAEAANAVLAHKGETVLLTGRPELRTRIVSEPGQFDLQRPHTVVARTNAAIIQEAVRGAAMGQRLHFVGGIDGYPLGLLEDAYHLWRGERGRVNDPALRAYSSWDDLAKTAKVLKQGQEVILVKMVEKHRDNIPSLLEGVRRAAVPDASQAHLTLTSAHKSKGLEWKRVRLTEDFFNPFTERKPSEDGEFEDEETRRQRDSEELNLLYVAATRAEEELCLNEPMREFVRRRQLATGAPETVGSDPLVEVEALETSEALPLSTELVPISPPSFELGSWQDAAQRLVQMGPQFLARLMAEVPPEAIHQALDAVERGEPVVEALAVMGSAARATGTVSRRR